MPRNSPPWYDPFGLLRWEYFAVLAWAILLLVTSIQVLVKPRGHSVYPIFEHAGESWSRGESVYGDKRKTHRLEFFRYSPTVAAIFVPFSAVPARVGGLIWRLGNAAVFLCGLAWWFRVADFASDRPKGKRLAWLFLLVIPLSAASLHNSQSNPLVMGLLLIATASAAESRWTPAALAIALATAFKVYPLAVGLLIAVSFPRPFARRLAAATGLMAFFPFLTQRPSYVLSQYVEWWNYLRSDVRHHVLIDQAYRDVRLFVRGWGVPVGDKAYMTVQLVGAALAAWACFNAWSRGRPARQRAAAALGLGTLWMTLLGPATESCTYMFIAPTLAIGLIQSWVDRRTAARILFIAALLLFLADPASLSVSWGAFVRNRGLLPLAGLLTLAGFVRLEFEARLDPRPLPARDADCLNQAAGTTSDVAIGFPIRIMPSILGGRRNA